jgi:hypothetical protein
MPFFITNNGQVRIICKKNEKYKPFNTEQFGFINWFNDKYDAYAMRDIIEENFPRAYLNL